MIIKKIDNHEKGVASIALGGVMMASAVYFIRMLPSFDGFQLTFLRQAIAALFLLPLVVKNGGFKVEKLKIIKNKVWFILIFSILVSMIAYVYSVQMINPTISSLLMYLAPIYVAILAPILINEKPIEKRNFCFAIAIIGLIFVLSPSGAMNVAGVIAGVISGLAYASVILCIRVLRLGNVDGASLTFYNGTAIALLLFPFAFSIPTIVAEDLFWMGMLGIIGTAIGATLINYGAGHCTSQEVSLFALAEPVSVSVISWLFLSEILTLLQVLGGVIIIFALLIVEGVILDSKKNR